METVPEATLARVLAAVDERTEPHAERVQVEDRVDEARSDRAAPDALVLREPVLVRAEGLEDAVHVGASPPASGR